jgi:hypothetical protein
MTVAARRIAASRKMEPQITQITQIQAKCVAETDDAFDLEAGLRRN